MAHTDGEEENCQCAQNNQGQGDSCVPAVAGMEPGNDAEVHGDAQTVQKQRDSKDSLGRKENRQAENPQDDTGADDIEGPVGKCDKKRFKRPQTTAVVARQTAMRMAVSLRMPEST